MTLLLIGQFAPVSASKLVPVWVDAYVRAPQRADIKVENDQLPALGTLAFY